MVQTQTTLCLSLTHVPVYTHTLSVFYCYRCANSLALSPLVCPRGQLGCAPCYDDDVSPPAAAVKNEGERDREVTQKVTKSQVKTKKTNEKELPRD